MKLYGLTKDIIINVIKNGNKITNNNKIIYLLKVSGNKFPIKVVTVIKNDYIFIVTAYPLKRKIEK